MATPRLTPEIPDKFYFKIGEVGAITGLPTYVLRFWETEFKQIRPKRAASGQRLYRKKDVALILEIKHLLYERKFTIQGAKQTLEAHRTPPTLAEIRAELKAIRELLDRTL
ncbi:MAG: MerR family transcriptional regulator [Desulfobacteraceae bacterium]|jgi:DNA-binding transcriptional MerR regulator